MTAPKNHAPAPLPERRIRSRLELIYALALAILAATPPTIAAWATLNQAQRNHDLINSRMTELLATTVRAATADALSRERAIEDAKKAAVFEYQAQQATSTTPRASPAPSGSPAKR